MPLLLITADFPPICGGESRHLYNLWADIASREVLVLAPLIKDSQQAEIPFTGKIIRRWIPLGETWRARLLRPFAMLAHTLSIVHRTNISSIHCGQLISAGLVGYALQLTHNIPYFLYVNGADLLEFKQRFPWAKILPKILGRARLVFVNSRYTKELVQGAGLEEKYIRLIHPAINPKLYNPCFDSSALRKRWGLEGKRVLLTVGRLVERKGHDTVICALPEIIKQVPDVHYVIVGQGPYKNQLKKLMDKLGLSKHVTFTGFIPDAELPAYYTLCQIFIMVSREIRQRGDVEGFGIVYLEANAAAKPVIAGNSGGVEDAVIHQLNGLLVEPCSVTEICDSILKLLRDDALRKRLGINGKQRVIEEFDRQKRTIDFETIIRQ
jgi:phosphatidylinositol alpha-1,6-mannosyltransferase